MTKLNIVSEKYAMQAMVELYKTPFPIIMVADGNDSHLEIPTHNFSGDIKIYFKDQPNYIINADTFKTLLLKREIKPDRATLIGSHLSFGPGKVYFNDVLVFEVETDDHEVRLDYPHHIAGAEAYIDRQIAVLVVNKLLEEKVCIWLDTKLTFNEDSPVFCNDLSLEMVTSPEPNYDEWIERLFRANYYGPERYSELDINMWVDLVNMMKEHRIAIAGGIVYVGGDVFDVSPYFN